MELSDTRTNHIFLIDSDSSGHRLPLDEEEIGTFPTLNSAEEKAVDIAHVFRATATPRFELNFAWTLSDVQVRGAALHW